MTPKELAGLRVGFAITGSFCTFDQVLPVLAELAGAGAVVTPILSYATAQWDTRFFKAADFRAQVEALAGRPAIDTVAAAEPIGPKKLLDLVVLAPCTGNSLAKLAGGVIDTPAVMAAKSQLRNGGPVVLAISTNDGLAGNARNIGQLLNTRSVFFVPFGQDDPERKPRSTVAHFALIPKTIAAAMEGRQLQPLLLP